jgi:hypothetical protein
VIEIVIGDVHARPELLHKLLTRLGVLDSRDRRRNGFWIVQVGDLLDRRATPNENLITARLAVEVLDVVLAGNHEVEMLASRRPAHGAALATLAARGWPQAAAEVCGWLVSHAGVHPELTHGLPDGADECAAEINDRWHRRAPEGIADPLFDWVGPARGGVSPYGGLFWSAGSEWPPRGRTAWGQICGHAPQSRPRLVAGPRWLIDVGGRGSRLAAVVRSHRSRDWAPFMTRLPSTRAAAARPVADRLRGRAA